MPLVRGLQDEGERKAAYRVGRPELPEPAVPRVGHDLHVENGSTWCDRAGARRRCCKADCSSAEPSKESMRRELKIWGSIVADGFKDRGSMTGVVW